MEKIYRDQIRVLKYKAELHKWNTVRNKSRNHFYIVYLILILCLAYIVDEVATNINAILQNDVIVTFFNNNLSTYTIATTVCSGIAVFSFFFRALADRFGRKPFLVINLFGMALGMLICFCAPFLEPTNVVGKPLYLLGLTVSFFFTPCDIQVLYIIEISNEKRRALNLSLTKAVGILGITIIPLIRNHIDGLKFLWSGVFLIPAILGFVTAVLSILFAKESDVFIESRIDLLNDQIRHKKTKKELDKENKDVDGGILPAIKYMFKHKPLLWMFFLLFAFSITAIITGNFSTIMKDAISYQPLSESDYNIATFIYPFVTALIILANGLISDLCGRRVSAIFDSLMVLIGTSLFVVSVRYNWYAYYIGIFLGTFFGGFLSGLDTVSVMSSESCPTNLRSSIMSVISVAGSAGTMLATAILLICNAAIKNLDISILVVCVVPPFMLLSLYLLRNKIPETKGTKFLKDKKEKVNE